MYFCTRRGSSWFVLYVPYQYFYNTCHIMFILHEYELTFTSRGGGGVQATYIYRESRILSRRFVATKPGLLNETWRQSTTWSFPDPNQVFFCFFLPKPYQTLSAVLSEHCAVSVKHFEEFALEILWKRQHLIIWASSNSQDVNARNVAAVCCVHYNHCISSSAPDSM